MERDGERGRERGMRRENRKGKARKETGREKGERHEAGMGKERELRGVRKSCSSVERARERETGLFRIGLGIGDKRGTDEQRARYEKRDKEFKK